MVCATVFAQSTSPADRQKLLEQMFEAMASRNKEPAILEESEVPSKHFYSNVPVVSAGYDWDEQDRVRKAVNTVRENISDEMWWQLRHHINDQRYSLTIVFDEGINVRNVGVGEFCRELTQAWLREAYRKHLPTVSGRLPTDFGPEAIVSKNEKQWDGRPISELQIAVCEEAVKQFTMLKGTERIPGNDYREAEDPHAFTKQEKARFTDQVFKQIEELKQTKKTCGSRSHLSSGNRSP